MKPELYRVLLDKHVFIFLDINNSDESLKRLSEISEILKKSGAIQSTTRTFLFHKKHGITVDNICELINNLEYGDCVHIIYEKDGEAHSIALIPPRIAGGIEVKK